MISLPNGCSCSQPNVYPKNWKTVAVSVKKDWYIQYYFHDPSEKGRYKNGKLVIVKGMNRYKTVSERRTVTGMLLKNEMDDLLSGYNPIKRSVVDTGDLSPHTPFIAALRQALSMLKCAANTKMDIKSTIKYIEASAKKLSFDFLPVGTIRRRHIKRILENCDVSDNTYNSYRKNLSILYKELLENDAVETNVLRDISKRKVVKRLRKLLTPDECRLVSEWAAENQYRFYLLIHIFFHTGCRTTEIFRVKREHVNLDTQTVLITVLKGNQPFEVLKPIKNIVVPYWRDAIEGAEPNDFIFSKGLVPGAIKIDPRQATIRWRRHIKGKLGIDCHWYSLKHLNSDQIAASEGLEMSATLNSHTNLNTARIYAIGEKQREMDRLKKVANKFA